VSGTDRKARVRDGIVPALRAIDPATDAAARGACAAAWGRTYPAIPQSWRRAWERVVPCSAGPEGLRRIVSTTTAIAA
jgi:transposase-like protein